MDNILSKFYNAIESNSGFMAVLVSTGAERLLHKCNSKEVRTICKKVKTDEKRNIRLQKGFCMMLTSQIKLIVSTCLYFFFEYPIL